MPGLQFLRSLFWFQVCSPVSPARARIWVKNKVGQRTQKQNGTEQTIFSCMSGTALWAQAYDAIWASFQLLWINHCIASSRRASGLAPSQRSFPKLFARLHPVEHPVSLCPSAVSPSYFHGFIPSSIRSRSLPAKFPQAISPSYFHGFIPSRLRSRSLPAQFPQAIFQRLHPVEHPVSLPPSEVSPS